MHLLFVRKAFQNSFTNVDEALYVNFQIDSTKVLGKSSDVKFPSIFHFKILIIQRT